MSISKITVDLKAKTFTIEVPDDKIESILDKVEALFLKVPVGHDPAESGGTPLSTESQRDLTIDGIVPAQSPASTTAGPRKRGKGPSKLKSWTTVDLGFSQDQRNEIRTFFVAKAPVSQGEAVAVLIVKAFELTKKREFDGNGVHSLIKIADQPTPKNLTAVFGNMKRDGLADYKDNMIVVTSFTEDEVKFKMPKSLKAART